MTALTYVFTRLYRAFVEARRRQVETQIRRYKQFQ